MRDVLAPIPDAVGPTLQAMHAYARAVGALPRIHAISHPLWWHAALDVSPTGMATTQMALPEGYAVGRLDHRSSEVVLETSHGRGWRWSMRDGMTGSEMAAALIHAAGDAGLEGDYDAAKYASDEPTEYDPAVAVDYMDVLLGMQDVFHRHKATLPGKASPIHVWPHGFDLAFDWVGTRIERNEEAGQLSEQPATLNLGLYPKGEAYLYSNPWPFSDELTDVELPAGATWHTDGWKGSILPYDAVAGRPGGVDTVLAYAAAVFAAASPTLTA
jgi:Family of unknown function (DUF5996)